MTRGKTLVMELECDHHIDVAALFRAVVEELMREYLACENADYISYVSAPIPAGGKDFHDLSSINNRRIPQSRLSRIVIAISMLFNYTHSIGMLFGQGFVKDKATFRGVYRVWVL